MINNIITSVFECVQNWEYLIYCHFHGNLRLAIGFWDTLFLGKLVLTFKCVLTYEMISCHIHLYSIVVIVVVLLLLLLLVLDLVLVLLLFLLVVVVLVVIVVIVVVVISPHSYLYWCSIT